MARLRRSQLDGPGIRRRRQGRGFVYLGPDGTRITDRAVLDRICALAVPPAWTDVWIAPWPNQHIQAVGLDARGRRQYRYHDAWRLRRDAEKFRHMARFAATVGPLRAVVDEHLAQEGPTGDRVLACAVRLLDVGFFRIGTEGYAEANNTFGLATMRREHVRIDGHTVTFDYTAKSGKRRIQSVVDAEVADVVAMLKRRRGGGPELLAHKVGRHWRDVRSTDINAYLKGHTGEDITAKDFRTWHATVLCAVGLAARTEASSATARKRAVTAAVKEVAAYLGNTPTVCRNSYVDPRVIDRYHTGSTIAPVLDELADAEHAALTGPARARIEAAVLALIDELPDEPCAQLGAGSAA
jgi:DNA topoisomerase I